MVFVSVVVAAAGLLLIDRYLFDLTSLVNMVGANIKEML
jgi:hypothetical protein